jgi:ribulose-phosphate 3-epimerase
LQVIRGEGKKAGVALNPATPVSLLENVLGDIDLILIMSVNPGFGGQQFLDRSLAKIAQAKTLIGHRPIELEVDGGIAPTNAGNVARAGATVLVAGTAVYCGGPEGYRERIAALRQAAVTISA